MCRFLALVLAAVAFFFTACGDADDVVSPDGDDIAHTTPPDGGSTPTPTDPSATPASSPTPDNATTPPDTGGGEKLYTCPSETICSARNLDENTIGVYTLDGTLLGSWDYSAQDYVTSLFLSEDIILGFNDQRQMLVVTPEAGPKVFSTTLTSVRTSLVHAGQVYAVADGGVYSVDPNTGTVTKVFSFPENYVGAIYLGHSYGPTTLFVQYTDSMVGGEGQTFLWVVNVAASTQQTIPLKGSFGAVARRSSDGVLFGVRGQYGAAAQLYQIAEDGNETVVLELPVMSPYLYPVSSDEEGFMLWKEEDGKVIYELDLTQLVTPVLLSSKYTTLLALAR